MAAAADRGRIVQPPRFSVVVPTHSRPRELRSCLAALAALDYPSGRFEVLVVDDGSPEPPRSVVDQVSDDLDVTLLSQRRSGPAAARNTGAAHASGDYVAFTDDDCTPTSGWLTALSEALRRAPDALVGGRTMNALTSNTYSVAAETIMSHLYAHYNADPQCGRFVATNNVAVALDAFRAIGEFDTRFPRAAAEDREFCDRWRDRGGRIVYAPDALVLHSHELTFRKLWRQQFEYGRGAYAYRRIRALAGRGPVPPEPRTFYVDLVRRALSGRPPRSLVVASLVVLSRLPYTLGFAWERTRPRRPVHSDLQA